MSFTCPECGHTGDPEDVENDILVDAVGLTCASCGWPTVKPVSFAKARREQHRAEVRR